jgi:hypothetical protein
MLAYQTIVHKEFLLEYDGFSHFTIENITIFTQP